MVSKEDYLMREIMNLSRIWHRVIESRMADLGLTSIQSRMLGHLYYQNRHGTQVFQRELEEEFKIRKSSITSVIQILEKKGLVRRIGVPGDARKKELMLTEQGISVQEMVIDRLNQLEELVKQTLSEEERRIWFSSIRKIETRLEEADYD